MNTTLNINYIYNLQKLYKTKVMSLMRFFRQALAQSRNIVRCKSTDSLKHNCTNSFKKASHLLMPEFIIFVIYF